MKGIILAGGHGTRLQPMTLVTNKHLLPVYDRPMIYHPIETLVSAGVRDVMILTGVDHSGDFVNLLGNGSKFGASFTYRTQEGAGGIAEALGLCRGFVGEEPMVVILGDNIFEDGIKRQVEDYQKDHGHAMVFLKKVPDPTRFGVATVKNGIVEKIVEKPERPESDLAVTGLYFYNASVWHVLENLKPSARGELEITDVNNWYVRNAAMKYKIVKGFWSDAGTIESLFKASRHLRERAREI